MHTVHTAHGCRTHSTSKTSFNACPLPSCALCPAPRRCTPPHLSTLVCKQPHNHTRSCRHHTRHPVNAGATEDVFFLGGGGGWERGCIQLQAQHLIHAVPLPRPPLQKAQVVVHTGAAPGCSLGGFWCNAGGHATLTGGQTLRARGLPSIPFHQALSTNGAACTSSSAVCPPWASSCGPQRCTLQASPPFSLCCQ